MSILICTNMYDYTYEGWGRAMWQVEFHQIPTQFTQIDYFKLMAKKTPRINKKKQNTFSASNTIEKSTSHLALLGTNLTLCNSLFYCSWDTNIHKQLLLLPVQVKPMVLSLTCNLTLSLWIKRTWCRVQRGPWALGRDPYSHTGMRNAP